jgi:hypothetical protein
MAYNRYSDPREKAPADDLVRFKSKFRAEVADSKEYRRHVHPPMDFNYTSSSYYEMEYKVEPLVAIHLPKEQFQQLVEQQRHIENVEERAKAAHRVLRDKHEEECIRNNNPTAKLAYEKYKMLLELSRK